MKLEMSDVRGYDSRPGVSASQELRFSFINRGSYQPLDDLKVTLTPENAKYMNLSVGSGVVSKVNFVPGAKSNLVSLKFKMTDESFMKETSATISVTYKDRLVMTKVLKFKAQARQNPFGGR